jgi:DNA-directed RNA polymerase specialized sigma24 family protein
MSSSTPTLQRIRFEEVTPANEYAAFFDASIESLVAHLDLPIFEGYDDLDDLRFAFLTLPSGATVTLGQYPRAPEPGIYLYVVAITEETPKLVVEVCQQLRVAKSEILWVSPDFQDEFERLYSANGDFPRQHQTPQIEEVWETSTSEPIDCFQHSLQIYTRQKFPEYWAMLQHNLGLAYYHRNRGDRRENLEKSIECFNNSLQVYTQSEFPTKWEINQHDLKAAYRSFESEVLSISKSLHQCSNYELILLAQSGLRTDRAALTELMCRHQSHVDRILYHLAPDWQDLAALSQEVWIRVDKNIKNLNEPEKFRGWLSLIATNLFYDELRKRKRVAPPLSLDAPNNVDELRKRKRVAPPLSLDAPSNVEDGSIEWDLLSDIPVLPNISAPLNFTTD